MNRSLPPLTWFRAFESAARNMSFTLAAQELNLTQSAVSQHIRSLEQKFGCALFVRKHRGIALTDQGRRLLPTVANAINILQSAAQTFETANDKRLLTISVSSSLAQFYIAPRLKDFAARHEDVAFRVISKVWPDEFAGSNADIEIRFDAPNSAASGSKRIGSNAIVAIAASDEIPRLQVGGMSPDEISSRPLIEVLGTADTWSRWAQERDHAGSLNVVCNVESHGAAVDFARAGTGIALTSFLIAAPCLADGSVVLVERAQLTAHDGFYLSIAQNDNAHLAGEFSDWLQNEIATAEHRAGSGSVAPLNTPTNTTD